MPTLRPLLLDTCTVIWVMEDDPLSAEATDALNQAAENGAMVYVCPITAWEVGLLAARQRIRLPVTPAVWFQRLLLAPDLRLSELSPEVLIASSFLPGTPPRDPADRIIAATAREFGYTLVTRDRLLLDYGQAGHLHTIAC